MPTANAVSFLDTLKESGLVDQDKLNDSLSHFTGSLDNTGELSSHLVRKKVLTEFQVKMLQAGKYKNLTMGPYSILNKIGAGGMGIVYLAEHRKLGRRVAIKVLPEDRTKDKLALERFYREARSVAMLDHPNIVKAHDVNEQDGIHYLVMEYVNGITLQAYVEKKGVIPWRTAVNIIVQVCRGLQHAHEKNLIHRDIKPANLLIDKTGQVKILDLGLARSLESKDDNLTADLSNGKDIQGSIDYVSPEQALGRGEIDIRTDIYSLGATAYTIITGSPIVSGSPAQKLLQHQLNLPTPLDEVRPEIPHAFAMVIQRMLAKRPDDRQATPEMVISELKQFYAPNTGTLLQAAVMEEPITVVEERPDPAFSHQTTSVMQHDTEVGTRKLKKSKGKKFKKKSSNGDISRWIVIAAGLVLVAAVGYGGYLLISNMSKGKSEEASNTPGKAAVIRKDREAVGGSKGGFDLLADKNPPPTKPPADLTPAGTGRNTSRPETPAPGTAATTTRRSSSLLIAEGDRLPDIIGRDLKNAGLRLSDFDGKVVLLNFWSYDNILAGQSISQCNSVISLFQNRPFAVVGVNNDTTDKAIRDGMQRNPPNFRSFRDKLPNGQYITDHFGVKTLPTQVLIDHQGVVRKIWVGAVGITEFNHEIEKCIKLSEK